MITAKELKANRPTGAFVFVADIERQILKKEELGYRELSYNATTLRSMLMRSYENSLLQDIQLSGRKSLNIVKIGIDL